MSVEQFTPRDVLAGHLAAVIPAMPQTALESAADGLATLGYRLPDYAATLALISAHHFLEEDDGDGWNEPRVCWYRCSCGQREYAEWTQKDPELTGLEEFQSEGHDAALALHHAHVAEVLTGAAPEDVPKPEFYPLVTEESIVAATNQLRSQLGDFTSPDMLMRKRAKFVLRAALPYLGAELAR
ncbi:MAG TPA: hypothetical protein VF885_13115 [Arthrobacter sp.]